MKTTIIDLAKLRKIVDELERQQTAGKSFEIKAVTDDTYEMLVDVTVHPYVLDPVTFWWLKPGGGA